MSARWQGMWARRKKRKKSGKMAAVREENNNKQKVSSQTWQTGQNGARRTNTPLGPLDGGGGGGGTRA